MGLPCDWQINKHKISERGQYLLETGQWSDCKFIVGQEPHQQTLKGHKLFLAMSSPVFEAMFFGGMAEKNDPIPIRDVQPDAFKALLEYIYTDQIDLSSFEIACELCYCAKKYMLPSLVEKCTKYLWSDLSPKKACRAYEFAKLFEEPVLMEKCLQIICTRTDEVLKECSWEEVELGTLLTVLEQDNLQIDSEIELFNAVECWAKAESARKSLNSNDGKSLRSVIGNALLKIRFLTLSPREFAEGPCTSELLTQDEAFAILMNIVSNGNKASMPEGFSTEKHSRGKLLSISGLSNGSKTSVPEGFSTEKNNTGKLSSISEICAEYYKNKFLDRHTPHSSDASVECHEAVFNTLRVFPPTEIILQGPKFYSNRPIRHETVCINRNLLDCSLTFTVDVNICVFGVQVPTQIDLENRWRGTPYNELVYAHLLDSDGTRLTYTDFTTKVNTHTLVEIFFNRPVYIQGNKIYRVGVVFHTPGSYPQAEYMINYSISNSAHFTFNTGKSEDTVREGLIRSIIFTYH